MKASSSNIPVKISNATKESTLRIGVFNYKGGVGKTTFTANLGAAFALASNQSSTFSSSSMVSDQLSGPGLRVLMVDADPQCNLTSFYLPVAGVTGLDRAKVFGSDTLPVKIEQSSFIYDRLDPVVNCSKMSAFIGESTSKPLWQMLRRFQVKRAQSIEKSCFAEPPFTVCDQGRPDLYGDRLCILEGCQNLYDYETMFSEAFRALNTSKDDVDMNTLAFSLIFDILESKYGFDVILVDMNPSHSQLNKAIAIACDFILPVVQASLYSCASLHGLFSNVLRPREATNSNQVSGWLDTRDLIVERQEEMQANGEDDDDDDDFMQKVRLSRREPTRLLPLMVNNYPVTAARKKGMTTFIMQTQPSQFVYTMIDYIKNTTLKATHNGLEDRPSDMSESDLVVVDEQYVVPFLPSLPLGVSAAEEMGRPFVEANSELFKEYWDVDIDEDNDDDEDELVVANILQSLDDSLDTRGKWRRSSQRASPSSSSQPKKKACRTNDAGYATKAARTVKKKNPTNMKTLYAKMDTEFRVGEERFVSLGKWLATLRGRKNVEAEKEESLQSY